jgi:hypothetical protein
MKTRCALAVVASIIVLGGGGNLASADSITGTINQQWIIATPIFDLLSLPAVQSIDSIHIQIAHTNAHDLVIFLDALAVPGESEFDLMFQETASGGSTNFSMGLAIENGSLANVATYTFVPSGGGGYTAPHTPSGLLNANSWTGGPLEAQDYLLTVGDTNLVLDGGAIGSWTINYTPVPAPGALALLALAGMTAQRRRI